MKTPKNLICHLGVLLAAVCAPAHAAVAILSMQPSVSAPQVLGTTINWVAKATDSNTGPLTFQFNVAPPGSSSFALARDFNVGTLSNGTWISPAFAWTPTSFEGKYQIQVVIKDFTTVPAQTASGTVTFQVTPLATGSTPVATPTANPLVALFSAPSCAAGSNMRVVFQEQSLGKPATTTNAVSCHPPLTMNVEIAGMYPSTAYNMYSQTITGGVAVNGPTVSFTTGALPSNVPFPPFKTILKPQAQADSAANVLLLTPIQFGTGTVFPSLATNLGGQIIWYYYPNSPSHFALFTRPLPGGTFLTLPDSSAWNPASATGQFLSEIDLAGNVIRQTNTGIIQQELLAMGASDAAPCSSIPSPAPVGAACLGYFHHDAIQTLPNGQIAVIADIERIFPAGTQGDTSSLPVDIVGDMIIVLNSNWQVVWYFDAFQNDSGNGELDINRPAVLGETCTTDETECETMFLLGPGIAPLALDWLHANSLYYDPQDGSIVWSTRHQDWLLKINYNNGAGAGNILWLMGPDGDFSFNNIYNDPWPWFSHQHDAGIQGNGLGALTLFDNGNTRVTDLGSSCGPSDCDSRGMVLTVSVTAGLPCAPSLTPCGQVSPVLSVDLGAFSEALGSADLLSDGNYFFLASFIPYSPTVEGSASIEILPTAGTDTGTQVFDLEGPLSYRGWRMPSLYQPPLI